MLVVEGVYENGQLRLDTPVDYRKPVRVRVEFLDELSAAVHPPANHDPDDRMRRLQASWEAGRKITAGMTGPTLSEEVLAEREEEI
ncbi:hypothetical protein [Hymenobacter coccineus]|uniref:Uncharacterized protein n=1 Tax=Hymenobacter coccineus TaxID=1908235 RepID=A0A1G1THW2_9BACT|nr:hypothetical protein [Hymenobacter coccineus]OGX90454.1 hypothetical protein BEN49_06635 [Hymenobacter coccineus]